MEVIFIYLKIHVSVHVFLSECIKINFAWYTHKCSANCNAGPTFVHMCDARAHTHTWISYGVNYHNSRSSRNQRKYDYLPQNDPKLHASKYTWRSRSYRRFSACKRNSYDTLDIRMESRYKQHIALKIIFKIVATSDIHSHSKITQSTLDDFQ